MALRMSRMTFCCLMPYLISSCEIDLAPSAAERCESTTGMDEPQKIPDVEVPEGSTGNIGNPEDDLTIPTSDEEGAPLPEVILDLGGSDKYPDDTPFVEKVVLPEDYTPENVATVTVYYQEDESAPWIPVAEVRYWTEKCRCSLSPCITPVASIPLTDHGFYDYRMLVQRT